MKKQTFLITLLIAIAVLVGFWRENDEPKLSLNAGTALTEPLSLPEFSLVDMTNSAFTKASFKNKWSFVFFGYSHCPQICPTTLAAMKQISQSLHRGPLAQLVFISIDPEHDTPARLHTYFQQEQFKPAHFIGVTGDKETISKLARVIGIHVAKDNDASKNAEHIEHGGAILLVNPEGKIAAIFSSTNKPHAIAHDFKEIVHYYASIV